ncbi:hypothetical protein JZ751_003746, partial [Albula glossodonta]
MNCSALLHMLIFSSVMGFCETNEEQATRQSTGLHQLNRKNSTRHRLKRGWIWTQFFVQEEVPAPQVIGQLKSDSDRGDNSIKYILTGEGAGELFHINEYTGKIQTLKRLDREEKAFYLLRGQAIDRRSNQPIEPESEFIIKVQDTNDNMPQFINEPYVASIPEMCPVELNTWQIEVVESGPGTEICHRGKVMAAVRTCKSRRRMGDSLRAPRTTVVQVTATDADDPLYGNNAKLIFSVLQGEPYFSVEPKTGFVVTSWPNMDREAQESYQVIVQVKDMMGLSGGHSATTTVTVSLSDVNDNGPAFHHNLFTFAVAESAPVGTTVGRIMADDADVGVNARMNYSLEEAEGSDTFQIHTDPVTQEGVIVLAKPLDYETKRRFVMAAEAINDHIDTRFLSYNEFRDRTTLKIFVKDVDEPPVFSAREYEWKIQENMAAGTTVGIVSARDWDVANNPVRYYIDKGSDMKKEFRIDPDNGTITIAKALDRETSAWHNLTITAKETKQNNLFSSVLVFIKVLDVNDNAPQFLQSYHPFICEGVQSGELVQVISAVDQDDPPEGHHFYFSMVPEKHINPNFTLRDNQDNTASILTRRSSFTRQDRTQYLLPIVIMDSGSPALTSTPTLTIGVCSCNPNGHCPAGGVEAFALSMGLSIHTLIGILVSLLTLTVLSILMMAVRKHRKQQQKEEELGEEAKGTDRWDEVSQKVLRYSETEGGKADLGACQPVPLRPHPRRRERRLRREEVAASIRMSLRHSYLIGPEDEVFQQFILDRLCDADNDPYAPPFDCLRTYAFEGTGSATGSLSSLGSSTLEPSVERPRDPGARLMRLALWTGSGEEQTTTYNTIRIQTLLEVAGDRRGLSKVICVTVSQSHYTLSAAGLDALNHSERSRHISSSSLLVLTSIKTLNDLLQVESRKRGSPGRINAESMQVGQLLKARPPVAEIVIVLVRVCAQRLQRAERFRDGATPLEGVGEEGGHLGGHVPPDFVVPDDIQVPESNHVEGLCVLLSSSFIVIAHDVLPHVPLFLQDE